MLKTPLAIMLTFALLLGAATLPVASAEPPRCAVPYVGDALDDGCDPGWPPPIRPFLCRELGVGCVDPN